jgi:hypothetical protein
VLLDEIDLASRPTVHERRVASDTILEPVDDPARWAAVSGLGRSLELPSTTNHCRPPVASPRARRAWLLRRADGDHEWLVFDRSAGSERDLVLTGAFVAPIRPARGPKVSLVH